MQKTLPPSLTSYDFLKMAAVLLMIVDHFGSYFFPEEQWLRVIGRTCVPLWFFLVGYANSRDLSWPLWAGCSILVIGNLLTGMHLFPFNILATILCIRLVIDFWAENFFRSRSAFWAGNLILLAVMIPTSAVFEYGSEGFLLALFGYMMRHGDGVHPIFKSQIHLFVLFVFTVFVVFESLVMGLGQHEFFALILFSLGAFAILLIFRPMTFPNLTQKLPVFMTAAIQFMGRYTLHIYVGHLLLFKIGQAIIFPDHYQWFEWTVFLR